MRLIEFVFLRQKLNKNCAKLVVNLPPNNGCALIQPLQSKMFTTILISMLLKQQLSYFFAAFTKAPINNLLRNSVDYKCKTQHACQI